MNMGQDHLPLMDIASGVVEEHCLRVVSHSFETSLGELYIIGVSEVLYCTCLFEAGIYVGSWSVCPGRQVYGLCVFVAFMLLGDLPRIHHYVQKILTIRTSPARLGTRTKESNIFASVLVANQQREMKVNLNKNSLVKRVVHY